MWSNTTVIPKILVFTVPKTRNGKVMRRVIRSAYLGEDAGDLSALENPAAIAETQNSSEPEK